MQLKLTSATPMLVLNIILLLFIQPTRTVIISSSSPNNCTCVSTSTASSQVETSSITSSSVLSSSATSSSAPSSVETPEELFRRNHGNILIKTVDNVTKDDRQAIEDALNDYDQLDPTQKANLINEKNLLDALLNKVTQLEAQDKINQKKTTIQDAEANDQFKNIPVCENNYDVELKAKITDLLNDATVTINVQLVNEPKYEIEIIDIESEETLAFEIEATFTPCPNFLDIRAAKSTKEEIDLRIEDGLFLNLIVPNLNTTNMKAAVLARVEDLAIEFGTTITIINDSRSGSTYSFTFVIEKGEYSLSFDATATFTVG